MKQGRLAEQAWLTLQASPRLSLKGLEAPDTEIQRLCKGSELRNSVR